MKKNELNEILRKHKLWTDHAEGGERADLHGAYLRGAHLDGADLQIADLHGADLWLADLHGAHLRRANFEGAILRDADLQGADLRGARLRGADLHGANLHGADLYGADLNYAILRDAILGDADLQEAYLHDADLREAGIDYSCWPLWCGSLKAHVDDRIAIQLLYHTLSVVQYSPYVSEDIKRSLLTESVVELANRFHRVGEYGKLSEYEEGVSKK